MECQICNQPLIIAFSSDPYSDIGTTDVHMKRTFVCINPRCGNYCGKDLSNPKVISKEIDVKLSNF